MFVNVCMEKIIDINESNCFGLEQTISLEHDDMFREGYSSSFCDLKKYEHEVDSNKRN